MKLGLASEVTGMVTDTKIDTFARFIRLRDGPTDRPIERRTDRRWPLIYMGGRTKKRISLTRANDLY